MDDFSFPTIAVDQDSACRFPFPLFTSSPIRFLPSTKSKPPQMTPSTGCGGGAHRRSFTSVVEALHAHADEDVFIRRDDLRANSIDGRGRRVVDEEKMDKLWEDFNEELHRSSWDCKGGGKEDVRQKESIHELCYMEGSIIQRRRPTLNVMLKVLKKLFLIQ